MCELLGGQHSFGGGCQHKPGEDRVTADPAPSILGRNIKGKAIHSRLGRAIGGAEAVSEQGFTRTGVDDRSGLGFQHRGQDMRSEEHTSELQSLMRISYAVFCLQKQNTTIHIYTSYTD